MTTLGVLGAILFVALVVGATMVRRSEVAKLRASKAPLKPGDTVTFPSAYIETPLFKEQLAVVSARARKRRSDYGTTRKPKPKPEALELPHAASGVEDV